MPGPNTIEVPAMVSTGPTGTPPPAPEPKAPEAPEPKAPEAEAPKDIETGAEGGEGGEGGEGTGSDVKDAIKSAANQVKQKFEFVVDGKVVTKEYTPAQVKQMLQKAEGADRRFQDASRIDQMNKEILWLAKNAPEKLLSHPAVGLDPYKWAENLLYEKIKLEQMDPKERELMETQQKLKAIEEQKQAIERQYQNERLQKAVQYARENNQREISTALKNSGMPVNNYTMKRTAHYMLEAMDMNVKVTPEEVLPLVQEDYKNEQQALFSSADEETLASILGEENLKKIRKYEMARLKVKEQPKGERKNTSLRSPKPGEKKMTMDEFREHNEKIKRGEI